VYRTRQIGASPRRPAGDAWQTGKDLIVATLERSSQIVTGTVAPALAPLDGVATALIAAGHLDSRPMALVDGDLHVDLQFINGDASFTVEENLAPIPGGATATTNWKVYVNPPTHLAAVVDAACAGSAHLVRGTAPAAVESTSSSRQGSWEIDPDALRRIEGAS
jgi:hypothetical protein